MTLLKRPACEAVNLRGGHERWHRNSRTLNAHTHVHAHVLHIHPYA